MTSDESSIGIGIICGGTDLAEVTIRAALSRGIKPVVIAVENEADERLSILFENVHWLQVGNISKAIEIFKKNNIDHCIMVGRVDHRRIFQNINFEPALYKVYTALKDHKANSLLEAFVNVFAEQGIKFIDSTEYLQDKLASKGVLGRIVPDENIKNDIRFGWELARKMGELDIGQAVIVKDRAVVAIEAVEGTDEMISRSKTLCPSGAVLVKVSKPMQDPRFDIPVVGPQTMNKLASVKAAALAVEAGKTIVINLEEMVGIADKNGIAFIGIDESGW